MKLSPIITLHLLLLSNCIPQSIVAMQRTKQKSNNNYLLIQLPSTTSVTTDTEKKSKGQCFKDEITRCLIRINKFYDLALKEPSAYKESELKKYAPEIHLYWLKKCLRDTQKLIAYRLSKVTADNSLALIALELFGPIDAWSRGYKDLKKKIFIAELQKKHLAKL